MLAAVALAAALAATGAGASIGGAAAPVEPGVVDVTARLGYQGVETIGTGMVVTPSGEVLTNNHVIRGATSISVSDADTGRTYPATVVGYDPAVDVAVLELKGASELPTVPFGSSAKARVGDAVTAIGNAGGNGGAPVSASGKIDGLGRSITAIDESGSPEHLTGLIEMTAPLQPGDSGGPVADAAGEVIGMNTAGSGHFAFQHTSNDGFAIPIDRALSIANQIEHGRSSATVHVGPTAFLGVNTASPQSATGRAIGALITGVLPGTPAARAGLVRGDIVVSVDGRTIASPAALTSRLLARSPGATAALVWVDQSGKVHRASVQLANGPPQ